MYKLIIIDDEEKIASGMAQLFPWQNIGFEVVQVFTSARKALQYIAENPVDVVLTDIEMPDMNGLELSHRLMEYPNIQKIFFSSYSNYEYFRAALQNGVADYLMKPVAYSALLECFEKVKARLDACSRSPKYTNFDCRAGNRPQGLLRPDRVRCAAILKR